MFSNLLFISANCVSSQLSLPLRERERERERERGEKTFIKWE